MLTIMDIARVLSYYDLGILQSMTPASQGFVNETAFVQTSKGQYVVRRNHRRLGEVEQRYRHQLITRLRERNFPAPALIRTRDGDTLLDLDGRYYEVMTFIGGKDVDFECPGQLMSVGATLAQYHRIVEGIESPPGEAQLRYAPQSMQALIETILERDFMGDLTATLASYDARIAALRATLPNGVYESLPHVVIHGDVHRDNLLFAGDSVVALLDYDQIAWDTPLADLADALVAFASVDKSDTVMWGVFDGPLDEERADLLILAYTRSRTLTPAEVGMLPILLEVHWLKAELGRVVSTPEGAPDYHMAVLEQGLELSQWIQERRESLTKRWIDIATGAEERVTASAA